MRFEYEINFFDYIKFQIAHQFFSLPIQIFLIFFAILVPIIDQMNGNYSLLFNVITALILFIFLWIIQVIFILFYYRLKTDHNLFTHQTVEILDSSLHTSNKFGESSFFWNKKIKIIERMGNVCIYVSANMAILIPKRIFQSKIQRKELIVFVNNKVENSDLY